MASLMNAGTWLASTASGRFGSKTSRKWRKPLRSRFQAELLVLLQGGAVEGRVVVEGDAVEAEVGAELAFLRLAIEVAALDVVERGGAERQRRRPSGICCRG